MLGTLNTYTLKGLHKIRRSSCSSPAGKGWDWQVPRGRGCLAKLDNLNAHYLREAEDSRLVELVALVKDGIPRVVIGENRTFRGEEELLDSRGVHLEVLQDEHCVAMMRQFIEAHPALWGEDIGQEV